MAKLWAAILAVSLLLAAAPALAEDAGKYTRLVIPMVNQSNEMVVLSLDKKVTTPGSRYLDAKHAVTLGVNDPATTACAWNTSTSCTSARWIRASNPCAG